MNLTKTSIVVAFLALLVIGCHSTKVGKPTAFADSLTIAAKKQERMDSVIREYRISEAKKEREREEVRKQNPQNLIDSIKLGLADGIVVLDCFPVDSVWVYYEEAKGIPSILKEVFPNEFFVQECWVRALPITCYISIVHDNRMWGTTSFNELLQIMGNAKVDDLKRIEAYILWKNLDKHPDVNVLSITKSDNFSSDSLHRYNYILEMGNTRERYNYVMFENGHILDYGRSYTGKDIFSFRR